MSEEIDEIVEWVKITQKAIRDKHPEGDKFVIDKIECPICKTGEVRFIISDHANGHIHGHCSTENCISWME